jgi:small subunit ribosomal protein S4e
MHKTRQNISKIWPIRRKGTKYIVVPSHSPNEGIPLLIISREMLGIVKTRKELKRILLDKKILINNQIVKNDNHSLLLFDTLALKDEKKYYRLSYNNAGKLTLESISEKESETKICKVVNKKMLPMNKIQINFNDGRNILSKEKINVGDSAIINFKDKKIEKILHVKEKVKVLIIKGKHRGELGIIEKTNGKEIEVISEGKSLNIKLNELIVTN